MPRIQYISQAGVYHYHDLGVSTEVTWLDEKTRDRLTRDSCRPVSGWLLPSRPQIRAIAMNKSSTKSKRPPKRATMASDSIDLTQLESTDDDDDVIIADDDEEFVKASASTRPSGPGASQPRRSISIGNKKQSSQRPKEKPSNALTPRRNTNTGPIDLRSDTSSPKSGKQRLHEKASGTKSGSRTENVARKAGPLGVASRTQKRRLRPLDDPDSSGEEFPELRSPFSIPGLGKSSQPRQGTKESFASAINPLKRRLETESSNATKSQPSKKIRKEKANAAGEVVSEQSVGVSKKTPSQPKVSKQELAPTSRSSMQTYPQSPTSHAGCGSKLAHNRATQKQRDHQSSSPSGTRRSNDSGGFKKLNPIKGLRASQEKRSARQQSASQEEHKASSARETSSKRLEPPSLKQTVDKRPALTLESSQYPRENLIERSAARETDIRPLGGTVSDVPAPSSSPSHLRSLGEIMAEEAPAQPSRALELLSGRSKKNDMSSSRIDERRSSEEDQGYASLSSASADVQAQKGANDTVSSCSSTGESPDGPAVNTPERTHGVKDRTETSTSQKAESKESGDTNHTAFSTPRTRNDTPEHNVNDANDPLPESAIDDTLAHATAPEDPEDDVVPHTATSGSRIANEIDRVSDDLDPSDGVALRKILKESSQVPTEAAQADDQLQSEALRAQTESVFAVPGFAASTLNGTAAYAKLSLASKVEKALGPYLEELAEDNEYWTSNSLRQARLSKKTRNFRPVTSDDDRASFAQLEPLKGQPAQKSDSNKLAWGVEKMSSGKPVSSNRFLLARQTFCTDAKDVPGYAHYVGIPTNLLSHNEKILRCWPYFGDNFEPAKQAGNLIEQYHLDIEPREQKLLRLRQAQKYEEYVESALADLDCCWADVLRFLLDPQPAVGNDPSATKALKHRQDFCKEEFDRESRRWIAVLASLPPSTPEQLARAAVLCENFQKLARFPIWHIAKRSDLCKLPQRSGTSGEATVAADALTCRICLRFDCPYHGELKETPDADFDDAASDTSDSSVVATDVVHPPKINYRTRVACPTVHAPLADDIEPTVKPERKDVKYWQNFQNKADERGPFYPCSHPGKFCDDEEADCSCYAENLACEKFCGCNSGCSRKFQGCSCSTQRYKGRRGPCFEDERCACWQLGRECDPDLCAQCGVCEVVDPVNKREEDITQGRCQNASIQRAVPRCTLLGDSGIHGLGLYACEDIRQYEFVGEYKGEIITKEEAERRGAVYEHQKLSYLFSLNKDQEIDSTYFGNKIRFINHASDDKQGGKANLYPRIIMVNTVHRIALYARHHIKSGEELLFNYGPMFPDEQLGGKKSKKSAPHVRNANLVREFYDIEEDEDELGNVRAKGVTRGTGGRKAKGPRGGARPGAGRKPRSKQTLEPQTAVGERQDERVESPFDEDFADQDAGQRLAAFNIADDERAEDQMNLHGDAEAAADEDAEDDDDEYRDLESESAKSEVDEISEDDEVRWESVTPPQRNGRRGRASWRA